MNRIFRNGLTEVEQLRRMLDAAGAAHSVTIRDAESLKVQVEVNEWLLSQARENVEELSEKLFDARRVVWWELIVIAVLLGALIGVVAPWR